MCKVISTRDYLDVLGEYEQYTSDVDAPEDLPSPDLVCQERRFLQADSEDEPEDEPIDVDFDFS